MYPRDLEPYQVLEERIATWCGRPKECVVACSSGTAALHLALETLQLADREDSCIVPDFTMVACARAVSLAGMVPHFVDCASDTLLIDPTLVHGALRHTRDTPGAIMAVHVYGRRCDMEEIHTVAESGTVGAIPVIEDLAEAHGIIPHPDTYAACWSFYHNKIVCGEEGGAIAFHPSRPDAAMLARSLRCLGFDGHHNFHHIPRGHNYRLANLLATPIIRSLEEFSINLANRMVIEKVYDSHCPEDWKLPSRLTPWVYDLRIPGLTIPKLDRIISTLREHHIDARHSFKPMSSQEEYRKCGWERHDTPSAYIAANEVFYLPISCLMQKIRSEGGGYGPDVYERIRGVADNLAGRAFDVIRRTLAGTVVA